MKPRRLVKSVSTKLDLLRFPAPPVSAVRAGCLNCSSPLVLHQPDPDSPERLLGVCEDCKHWYLIDLLAGQTEGVMTRLPGTEVIRGLSRENPSAGISLPGHEPDPAPIPPPGPDPLDRREQPGVGKRRRAAGRDPGHTEGGPIKPDPSDLSGHR